MKTLPTLIGLLLLATLCTGAWVLRYHPDWLQPAVEEVAEDEDVDPQKLEIPIHLVHVKRATLHRFIDAIGTIEPAPPRPGQMAGTASVAAPVAGVISKVLCVAGQQVRQGDALVQLDDRLAVAAEHQAAAALAEAKASQKLIGSPRPEQLEVARLKIETANRTLTFAQSNATRQQELAKNQGTSEKNVEQATLDLSSARNEVATAENELALLKPSAEQLAAEEAKVASADAALAAATTQREMLRIVAPIDATVIAVNGNPGESVDTAKVLIGLVALDRLVVNVPVPAQELGPVTAGMAARVLVGSSDTDAQEAEGKIFFVGSEVDRRNNTMPVGIDIPPSPSLRPGQSVRVRIVAEEHKDCLVVPKQSVVADENGDMFVALIEKDQATHKTVKLGLHEADLIEVVAEGLKDGDAIAGSGAYGLAKFQVAKVKVVEK